MTPLQRLRALLDASTKGPWWAEDEYDHKNDGCPIFAHTRGKIALAFYSGGTERPKANAAFIAAARNQMDRLLAVAEAAQTYKNTKELLGGSAYQSFAVGNEIFACEQDLFLKISALQSTENTDD